MQLPHRTSYPTARATRGRDGANRVLVIGSANVDVSVTTAVLPRPGETVAGELAVVSVGGKGANQAAAAVACGAITDFVARLGADAFGQLVSTDLAALGIGLTQVKSLPGESTGLAAIYVDHSGQNCIVVVAGANGRLTPADLDSAGPLIRDAGMLLLQCESPPETVRRAIELAAVHGTPVMLNPAPCHGIDLAAMPPGITYLIPNEFEASMLSGMPVGNLREASDCAGRLRSTGIDCVVITLGSLGCVLSDSDGTGHFPAHPVDAIDTTGAGDAFIGCLAASLASGIPRREAVRRAVVYASLSTTKRGAQLSYPKAADLELALRGIARPAGGQC